MPAALARGLAAGVAGTAAMTAWQELLPRLKSGGGSGGGEPSWDGASAPAQVARKGLRLVGVDPPASWIPFLTHAMHWGYGTGWGAVYGLGARGAIPRPLAGGAAFGTAVWAMSYVQLVPLGIYEPPWRYDAATLAEDWSYHLVYGVGAAAAWAALAD